MKFAKIIVYALFTAALLWAAGQLFFEKELEALLHSSQKNTAKQEIELKMVTPFSHEKLEPTWLEPSGRDLMVNIYESLIRADRDLKIRPALALSWGIVADNTWTFNLRPGVRFHDGSLFDADDVLATFERAKTYETSELVDFLGTIESIEPVDRLTLKITTAKPDPLLLQKLSLMLILPAEDTKNEKVTFSGTGPYVLKYWNSEHFVYERNSDYWGKKPVFPKVEVVYVPGQARADLLLSGDANFMDLVPIGMVDKFKGSNAKLASFPGLEVSFLLFNFNTDVFQDVESRQAFAMAMDQKVLLEDLGTTGGPSPAGQFVSAGIFGFNSDIPLDHYNLKKARELAKSSGLYGRTVRFQLIDGLLLIGEFVRDQAAKIGVNVELEVVTIDEIFSDRTDLYYLGYKADLGDGADFLSAVGHSLGETNLGYYKNDKVDELVGKSLETMDPKLRLKVLQEAMKIVVEDDPLGVPLFEEQSLYGFASYLDIEPRIDGLIYFDDLIKE